MCSSPIYVAKIDIEGNSPFSMTQNRPRLAMSTRASEKLLTCFFSPLGRPKTLNTTKPSELRSKGQILNRTQFMQIERQLPSIATNRRCKALKFTFLNTLQAPIRKFRGAKYANYNIYFTNSVSFFLSHFSLSLSLSFFLLLSFRFSFLSLFLLYFSSLFFFFFSFFFFSFSLSFFLSFLFLLCAVNSSMMLLLLLQAAALLLLLCQQQ